MENLNENLDGNVSVAPNERTDNQNLGDMNQRKANIASENPILIAHNLNNPINEYASPDLYVFNLGITYPAFGNARFKMKPTMLHMIQTTVQFGGYLDEDPQDHIKSIYVMCSSFHLPCLSQEDLHITYFTFTLKDDIKKWVGTLEVARWLFGTSLLKNS